MTPSWAWNQWFFSMSAILLSVSVSGCRVIVEWNSCSLDPVLTLTLFCAPSDCCPSVTETMSFTRQSCRPPANSRYQSAALCCSSAASQWLTTSSTARFALHIMFTQKHTHIITQQRGVFSLFWWETVQAEAPSAPSAVHHYLVQDHRACHTMQNHKALVGSFSVCTLFSHYTPSNIVKVSQGLCSW